VTLCRRCGQECGDFGFVNTLYNPWAETHEDFTLCDVCQKRFAQKTVSFLNDYTERVSQ
jgi:hypothetical protein